MATNKSTRAITEGEMSKPSEYGGDDNTPRPKAPHEQLREMFRSNPADPTSGTGEVK